MASHTSKKSGPRVPNHSGQLNIKPGQEVIDRYKALSDLTPYSINTLAKAALIDVLQRLPEEVIDELDRYTATKKQGNQPDCILDPNLLTRMLGLKLPLLMEQGVDRMVPTRAGYEANHAMFEAIIHDASNSVPLSMEQ